MACVQQPPPQPVADEYHQLRALVRTQSEQHAAIVQAERAAEERVSAAQAEAQVAREAATGLQEELASLRSESATLHAQAQRHHRAACAAEAAASAEAEQRLQAAVAAEAARYDGELSLLREAAQADVEQAREECDAQLSAAHAAHAKQTAEWEAQMAALLAKETRRAAKHAARMSEVIASEEACEANRAQLERALRTSAADSIGLGVRLRRVTLEARARREDSSVLARELAVVEGALEESEAERALLEAQCMDERALVQSEVAELRSHLKKLLREHKALRLSLAEGEAREERACEAAEQKLELAARQLAKRDEEHRHEISLLQRELASAREQHAASESVWRAQSCQLQELLQAEQW
jgi:hypothetical protein